MASARQCLRKTMNACVARRAAFPVMSVRNFNRSSIAFGEGQSDAALISRLSEEIKYERENTSNMTELQQAVDTFKQEGVWEIDDKPGYDEVSLRRTFANEEIRLLFSIADLDSPSPEIEGTEEESVSNTAQDSHPADEGSAEAFPVRTAITISKQNAGAVTIDAVAQDGLFMIDSVSFYQDEKAATDMTADGDWKRRALYMGPEFDALDEGLQQDFEAFLEERGINSNLALFVPDLAEWKEQKEYVRWLEGVKKFTEA